MLEALALMLVVLTALYFFVLAAASLLVPAKAGRFLLGFASSPRAHYIELFIRLLVGAALLIYASRMFAPAVFSFFGWLLIITTGCLFLLPWQWHQRFAQHAVPRAISYIKVIGISSLALGVLILTAVIRGNTV